MMTIQELEQDAEYMQLSEGEKAAVRAELQLDTPKSTKKSTARRAYDWTFNPEGPVMQTAAGLQRGLAYLPGTFGDIPQMADEALGLGMSQEQKAKFPWAEKMRVPTSQDYLDVFGGLQNLLGGADLNKNPEVGGASGFLRRTAEFAPSVMFGGKVVPRAKGAGPIEGAVRTVGRNVLPPVAMAAGGEVGEAIGESLFDSPELGRFLGSAGIPIGAYASIQGARKVIDFLIKNGVIAPMTDTQLRAAVGKLVDQARNVENQKRATSTPEIRAAWAEKQTGSAPTTAERYPKLGGAMEMAASHGDTGSRVTKIVEDRTAGLLSGVDQARAELPAGKAVGQDLTQRVSAGVARAEKRFTDTLSKIDGQIKAIEGRMNSGALTPDEASTQVREKLLKAEHLERENAGRKFNGIFGAYEKADATPLFEAYDNLQQEFGTMSWKNQMDNSVKEVITEWKSIFDDKRLPLSEITDFRSEVLAKMRNMQPRSKGYRMLNELVESIDSLDPNRDTVFNRYERELGPVGTQRADAYRAARDEYRNVIAKYRQGRVGTLFKTKRDGMDLAIPESKTLDTFFKDTDSAKAFNSYFGNDPEALRAGSAWWVEQFSNSANKDAFLRKNKDVLDLFPSIRKDLERLSSLEKRSAITTKHFDVYKKQYESSLLKTIVGDNSDIVLDKIFTGDKGTSQKLVDEIRSVASNKGVYAKSVDSALASGLWSRIWKEETIGLQQGSADRLSRLNVTKIKDALLKHEPTMLKLVGQKKWNEMKAFAAVMLHSVASGQKMAVASGAGKTFNFGDTLRSFGNIDRATKNTLIRTYGIAKGAISTTYAVIDRLASGGASIMRIKGIGGFNEYLLRALEDPSFAYELTMPKGVNSKQELITRATNMYRYGAPAVGQLNEE